MGRKNKIALVKQHFLRGGSKVKRDDHHVFVMNGHSYIHLNAGRNEGCINIVNNDGVSGEQEYPLMDATLMLQVVEMLRSVEGFSEAFNEAQKC